MRRKREQLCEAEVSKQMKWGCAVPSARCFYFAQQGGGEQGWGSRAGEAGRVSPGQGTQAQPSILRCCPHLHLGCRCPRYCHGAAATFINTIRLLFSCLDLIEGVDLPGLYSQDSVSEPLAITFLGWGWPTGRAAHRSLGQKGTCIY